MEVLLKNKKGKEINGIRYDFNDDGISDIFTYSEKIDETKWYTRLYVNSGGTWECKWLNLDEVCI